MALSFVLNGRICRTGATKASFKQLENARHIPFLFFTVAGGKVHAAMYKFDVSVATKAILAKGGDQCSQKTMIPIHVKQFMTIPRQESASDTIKGACLAAELF